MGKEWPEFVWDEASVEAYWDYQSQFPESYFSFQCGRELARKLAPLIRSSRAILDYGGGRGFMAREILRIKRGAECVVDVVDSSPDSAARMARDLGGMANFGQARVIDEAFLAQKRGCYDLIFLLEVVEHLYDDPLGAVLGNAFALLKEGGRLVVTTPNAEDRSKSMILNPETGKLFHRWQHVRSWSEKSLSGCLERHGFAVEKALQCNVNFATANPVKKLLRVANAARLGAMRPNLIIVARKPAAREA